MNPEQHLDTRFYKVVDNTLYYRYKWGTWKGQDLYQDRWYPVLTKKGKHWIGYNYSVKPCLATYLLHHPSEFTWRFPKLKWVELGRVSVVSVDLGTTMAREIYTDQSDQPHRDAIKPID